MNKLTRASHRHPHPMHERGACSGHSPISRSRVGARCCVPRELEAIEADSKAVEQDVLRLLQEVAG